MNKKIAAQVCFLAGWMALIVVPTALRAQQDSVMPSKDLATGHSYVGIDLGVTGSDYLGAHNFLWGIVTAIDPNYGVALATYLPFSNLGTGIGFVGGLKFGEALGHSFDLEEKVRFLTNHTSAQDYYPNIYLDPVYPNATSNATSTYALTLSSLDLALLGHLRLSDRFYAIGGFSASDLIKNGFSASQHLSGTYLVLTTHGNANISDQQTPEKQLDNWFYGYRADAQVGAGGVFRLGASNMLLDAELLVSIPFTQWLTKVADSSLKGTATFWTPRTTPPPPVLPITDPHLWYATLTIGLRLPFHKLPPPIPEPLEANLESNSHLINITTVPPSTEKNGGILLSGKVTDAATGKPLAATLTAVDLSNNKVIGTVRTDSNGNYSVPVAGPGKYSVTANANGHLFGTALFDVDSEGRILTSQPNIALSSVSSGGKTRLLVFFEFDKADLQAASSPELNRAVELMKAVPAMKVEIAGYSDTIGTLSHNLDLSLRRANAVRDFLIQHGIAPDRITAHGYGPASPIATNVTDEGRAENRRVEFVVKGE